ncbi:Uncharacterised protein [Serratia grimesii]|nr:Uncharacterised protein [Serratia grimesii]
MAIAAGMSVPDASSTHNFASSPKVIIPSIAALSDTTMMSSALSLSLGKHHFINNDRLMDVISTLTGLPARSA